MIRLLCLTALLQAVILSVTELFSLFWESINLLQFWPLVEIWDGNLQASDVNVKCFGKWKKARENVWSETHKKVFNWEVSHRHP